MSDEAYTGSPAAHWRVSLMNAFDLLVSGLNAVGPAWIFVIMVAINADVFSRFLFNAPISGVPLIVERSIIAIVFLQLAAALRAGECRERGPPLVRPTWNAGLFFFVPV